MSKPVLQWAAAIGACVVLLVPLEAVGAKKTYKKCVVALDISNATNPWKGFTSGYGEEQAGRTLQAVAMKDEYERLPNLSAYAGANGLALAVDRKQKRVIVNQAYFTDLRRADATRLPGDGKAIIGRYKDLGFSFLSPRRLVVFLLESQIIETYWHVESHLCLSHEKDLPASYTAYFTGSHVYYTNERNERPLSFSVVVDKKTGQMGIRQQAPQFSILDFRF